MQTETKILECSYCSVDVDPEHRSQWSLTIEDECNMVVCHDCGEFRFRACANCNTATMNRDTISGYCIECHNDIFAECENCYDMVDRDDIDSDTGRCPECQDHYSDYINRDGHEPNLDPLGDAKGKPHYGFEWEVEVNGSLDQGCADVMTKLPNDYCILKDDCTIEHGFELCTRPATIAEHKKAWQSYFLNPSRVIHSKPNCGVHVHISRAPLSKLQIGKMIVFVHGPDNEKFIEKRIAERYNYTYADFKKRRKITEILGRYHDRDAVNIDNSRTVELRMFCSTTDEVKFWKNLEFAEALTSFTHNSMHSIREMHWQVFQKFVKHNVKQWPNLHKVIGDYNE